MGKVTLPFTTRPTQQCRSVIDQLMSLNRAERKLLCLTLHSISIHLAVTHGVI
nr:MAG TPA: hypothetical protein [Caudoviricetes sp.]